MKWCVFTRYLGSWCYLVAFYSVVCWISAMRQSNVLVVTFVCWTLSVLIYCTLLTTIVFASSGSQSCPLIAHNVPERYMVTKDRGVKMEGHSGLLAAAVGLGCGLTLGWLLRGRVRLRKPSGGSSGGAVEKSFAADSGEIKLVIVVRNDLKMGKGKAAAQCAHAAVAAVRNLSRTDPGLLSEWEDCGQPKVVVKTETEASLVELASLAKSKGLMASIIRDAGRTQIAPGSKTVLGVGPGPADLVDEVTGSLRLY